MTKQMTMLFTGRVPVEGTTALAREILPDVRLVSIMDDSLLADCLTAGHLTKAVTRRICQYALAAEDGGADLILSQCSSVSEAIDVARPLVHVPILKIDEPMAEKAVEMGPRVAVVATLPTTLGPTSRLIERTAMAMGKPVQVQQLLAEGAFDVLTRGDTARHNAMVLAEIAKVQGAVDVIVLAQGSMAVLIPELEKMGLPALTSPRMGMLRARQMIDQLGG